jgi:hypothetical protein
MPLLLPPGLTSLGQDAIAALNSLQSNAAVLADIRVNWHANVHKVIPETLEYLRRAGYKVDGNHIG